MRCLSSSTYSSRRYLLTIAHTATCDPLTASGATQANSVGTVIKANGDVDPLGVVSVLPLDLHREHTAVKQARHQLCAK